MAVILDFRILVLRRCFAFHVTVSSSPINPVVVPAMASSAVWAMDFRWSSMLLARSKTLSAGAATKVVRWIVGIYKVLDASVSRKNHSNFLGMEQAAGGRRQAG